ncbi:MAG: hypothetical protein ACK5OR_03530, partial [Betaproteobacteria bacterium]
RGAIAREAYVNLIALRKLAAADGDADQTQNLQRYLLALALIALTLPQDYALRSGCLLVRDGVDALTLTALDRTGESTPFPLDHAALIAAATVSGAALQIGGEREVEFSREQALAYLGAGGGDGSGGTARKRSARARAGGQS